MAETLGNVEPQKIGIVMSAFLSFSYWCGNEALEPIH